MTQARAGRYAFLFFVLATLAGGMTSNARAQSDTIPPEVAALFEDIADIDKLRVLNPLKLKADQIDRLISLVRKSQADYDSKLAAAAVPPIRQMASEIKETRRKMLGGAAIPPDLDSKVKKAQEEFVKKRDQQDFATLKSMAEEVTRILTSEQKSKAAGLARDALTKDGKPTAKGDDEKFFNFFVLQVFIKYPRIVPLLEDIKRSSDSASIGRGRAKRIARGGVLPH